MLSKAHTVQEIAERWGCGEDKVLSLIGKLDLIAFNIAVNRSAKRPTWRITPEALADFERRRSTQPAPKQEPRRRHQTNEVPSVF